MNVNILRDEGEVSRESSENAWVRGLNIKWSQNEFYSLAKSNDILDNIAAAAMIVRFAESLNGAQKMFVVASMCLGTKVDLRVNGTINIG
jgi:hypothetical protein